jgi:ribosomal protein S18 acetylase RimI-like enzyme
MLPDFHPMTRQDLDFVDEMIASVGWSSQNRPVFEAFLQNDPAGCFIAEMEGRPIGTAIGTPYGNCGFIGEVIVREELRNQGIGRHLVEHVIAYLQSRGARSIYLDGAERAIPLYERLGFRRICPSLRLAGKLQPKTHPHLRPMEGTDLAGIIQFDRQAFGADRSFFLRWRFEQHPDLAFIYEVAGVASGYILARRYGAAVSVGPWLAGEAVTNPLDMLEALAVRTGDAILHIGVLECNTLALKLLEDAGFQVREDIPWRMVLGQDVGLGQAASCFAIGSPAKG